MCREREECRPNHPKNSTTSSLPRSTAIRLALEQSSNAWRKAVNELGHDTVEETRREYLRHAQSVWDTLRHQQVQPPHKIFAAIEIIGLLVNTDR